jgi:hypothetical protein
VLSDPTSNVVKAVEWLKEFGNFPEPRYILLEEDASNIHECDIVFLVRTPLIDNDPESFYDESVWFEFTDYLEAGGRIQHCGRGTGGELGGTVISDDPRTNEFFLEIGATMTIAGGTIGGSDTQFPAGDANISQGLTLDLVDDCPRLLVGDSTSVFEDNSALEHQSMCVEQIGQGHYFHGGGASWLFYENPSHVDFFNRQFIERLLTYDAEDII